MRVGVGTDEAVPTSRPPRGPGDTQAFSTDLLVSLEIWAQALATLELQRHGRAWYGRGAEGGGSTAALQAGAWACRGVGLFRKGRTEPLGGVSAGGEPRRHTKHLRPMLG